MCYYCTTHIISISLFNLKAGITLIEIPYWWDFTKESLAATIHRIRPELVPDPPGIQPIPSSNSEDAQADSLPIQHGQIWDQHQDLTGWWMSEKMDGIRGLWNGTKLLSRHGKQIPAPPWFSEGLPNRLLDGELWMGRGTFDMLMKTAKLHNSDWSQVGYYLYDLPDCAAPYKERLKQLEGLKPLPSHVHIVEQIECSGLEHLNTCLDEIVAQGAEGIMARDPHAFYAQGATSSLLKVKVMIYNNCLW